MFYRAAVLIPLFEFNAEIYVLLTKRSQELRSHAGDVCFPGGKMDEDDPSICYTAQREALEEIGLKSSNIRFLGQLMPVVTVNNIVVSPVVCVLENLSEIQLEVNDYEVDDVFACPLSLFLKSSSHTFTQIGDRFKYHTFTWVNKRQLLEPKLENDFLTKVFCNNKHSSYNIWGLTALYCLTVSLICLNHPPSFSTDDSSASTIFEKLKGELLRRLLVSSGSRL